MDSAGQTSLNLYGLLAAACLLIGISYSLELANSYTLSLYKLQVKEQLTTRIIKNSLRKHFLSSQSNSSSAEDKPKLWHKLSTTLPLYLNNYYDSLLSLIFESLSIVLITCYLYTQFSFALFFGICLSCCVLHKTL